MRKERDDDIFTVTSVSLPIWQVKWLRENTINRSELVRDLLETHISYATGFEGILKRLEDKKNALLNELEDVNHQIQTIKMSGVRAGEESDADRRKRVQKLMKELGHE